jgi:ribonuclease HI
MQSTHTATVEVIAGIAPLDLRFSYLNCKFLSQIYATHEHPLVNKLKKLSSMSSRKLTRDFSHIDSLEISPSEQYTQFNLQALLGVPKIRCEMKNSLASISKENYPALASTHFNAVIQEQFPNSTLIYTDGSRTLDETGFGVYTENRSQFGYRLIEPSSVFSAEIQALNHALEYIRSQPLGEFLVLTDSLSSIEALKSRNISARTHPISHVIKETLWHLQNSGYLIRFMWIPAHCNIFGNEEADRLAKEYSKSSMYARVKPIVSDFFPTFKATMLQKWQQRWRNDDMGRYTFSIYPQVSLLPWFSKLQFTRPIITQISRLISNHTRVKSHLNRINIVSEALCACEKDYETIDHLLWHCPLHQSNRDNLAHQIEDLDNNITIRDILAERKWDAAQACVSFLSSIIVL